MTRTPAKNAIVLFDFNLRSLASLLIALVTKSRWSHAAVLVDGVLYDASETREKFGRSDIKLDSTRGCTIWHLPDDCTGALTHWVGCNTHRRYDWPGVILWVLGVHRPDRWYCFEAAMAALHYAGIVKKVECKGSISANDLNETLNEKLLGHDYSGPLNLWSKY